MLYSEALLGWSPRLWDGNPHEHARTAQRSIQG